MTPVTVALMHRTVKYFITSTLKCFALAVAVVSCKSSVADQNMHNFTIFVPLC